MGLPATIATLLACYALGCVSPAYYAVKWRTGRDLRRTGTGNVGAANAGRILGKTGYVIIAVLDIFKGWAAMYWAAHQGLSSWWLAAVGAAVVAGHLWPAQLAFRGGKGVATAYGVIIFSAPWPALVMWGVFGASCGVLRSKTLGSMVTMLTAPLLAMAWQSSTETCCLLAVLAVTVILSHRQNIRETLERRRERAAILTESTTA